MMLKAPFDFDTVQPDPLKQAQRDLARLRRHYQDYPTKCMATYVIEQERKRDALKTCATLRARRCFDCGNPTSQPFYCAECMARYEANPFNVWD